MASDNIAEIHKGKYSSFPSRLRLFRVQQGWTQSELADLIGTTQINVSRWENAVSLPSPYFRRKLAELFGVSVEELLLARSHEENAYKAEKKAGSLSISSSILTIPYPRNPFFTGREEILSRLHSMLQQQKSAALTQAAAISGLGGVGKTQIALEYAYRYQDYYKTILWVDAYARDNFLKLAAMLDLPEQHEQELEIVLSAVKRWLATHTDWLLILDNVEDPAIIAEFLPRHNQGNILITTRLHTLGTLADSIEVEKMGYEEAVQFLLRRSRSVRNVSAEERALVETIVKALDALPLALDQAGAYMEENSCSFQDYLALYHSRRLELLQIRSILPTDHPQSVVATWSLSFEQIERIDPAAADLLRLISFLDSAAIPEALIIEGAPEFGPLLEPIATDRLLLNKSLSVLRRYSLVKRNALTSELSIHRLVAAVQRDRMDEGQRRLWLERALKAINRVFPEVDLITWERCQPYLAHALTCISSADRYGLSSLDVARLCNQVGVYLMVDTKYKEAEKLLQKSFEIRTAFLPPDHQDIASSQNDLGRYYLGQGDYKKARPFLDTALKIREQVLGRMNVHTATTLHNIALLCYQEGKYADAEVYCQQALAIRRSLIDSRPADVGLSSDLLAEIYAAWGKYEQAEKLYREALSTQREVSDPQKSIPYAQTLNNFARFYHKKAEYSSAEKLYSDALAIQRAVWGSEHTESDHPVVARTLNNLARMYRAQGMYSKAEELHLCVLKIREEAFGLYHLDVAESYYCLAKLYFAQQKYEQAQARCQQALTIQEQQLGPEHPQIASTLVMMARIVAALNDYARAEGLYERALKMWEPTLGPEHYQVAIIRSCLGELYIKMQRYAEAERLLKESLEIRQQLFGPNYQYLSYNYNNLGDISLFQHKYAEAEQYYLRALTVREPKAKAVHPQIVFSYRRLIELYMKTQRYQEAETVWKKLEQMLTPEYPDWVAFLENYADLLRRTGREEQAIEQEKRIKRFTTSL
jgi:tetratricopeptide (TPR) repeat protein